MAQKIGIRREDMYHWERRTPLVPGDLSTLSSEGSLVFLVQSSEKRAFSGEEYRSAGMEVADDLADCPIIIGLKEIPVPVLERDKVYVFFSHTIKGQPANMPMLQRCLDLGCTIIDYERIVDETGRRLIFFGNHAGLAGAIDTLWALGKRLQWEGIDTPLADLKKASEYADLAEVKREISMIGERIASDGLPEDLTPLVIGVTGYGNVSKGAQEILDLLPVAEWSPKALLDSSRPSVDPTKPIVKIVFREEDTVLPLAEDHAFDLKEYYDHPERYRAAFERYLPGFHALINCIYWEPKYPRLVTKESMRTLYADGQPTLRVIGDISCDIDGAVETTVQATEPDDPIYVYDAKTGEIAFGVEGHGPVMMAVEILPTELPRESSTYFSRILTQFIPAIAAADYAGDFDALDLPPELKRAMICHRGKLTPDYQYLSKYLDAAA